MMERDTFEQMVNEIMAQGHDLKTAAHYAALIGDLPERDAAGNLIVREHDRVVAKLRPLSMFEVVK